jgi:hypothetical protein
MHYELLEIRDSALSLDRLVQTSQEGCEPRRPARVQPVMAGGDADSCRCPPNPAGVPNLGDVTNMKPSLESTDRAIPFSHLSSHAAAAKAHPQLDSGL